MTPPAMHPHPKSQLDAAMARACAAVPLTRLGVAVSGGGDSVALMVLLADWARARGVALRAVSVDHGLRADSTAEAAAAGVLATSLGLSHDILRWDAPARGNLMDAARRGRQALIGAWARENGIDAVALGHSLDDQAETVLMRLGRGSGVDGLAGMAPLQRLGGVLWLRPLLRTPRKALRAELRARGIGWAEDPTNIDPRYGRTRARHALEHLRLLGIDAARLAETAAAMALARAALEGAALTAGRALLRMERGDALLEAGALDALEADLRERIVAHVLCALSGQPYRPRRAALRRALAAPRRATLHGCVLTRGAGVLRIGREWAAVAGLRAAPGGLWDGRWILHPAPGDAADGCSVAALGPRGLAALTEAREVRASAWGMPWTSLLAMPAVWRDGQPIAAPLLQPASRWRAESRLGPADLLRGALSD